MEDDDDVCIDSSDDDILPSFQQPPHEPVFLDSQSQLLDPSQMMDQDLDVTGVDQDDSEDISLTEKWFSIDQLLFYARNMNKGIEIEAFELKKGDGERTAWKSVASFGTSGQNHELLAINRVVDYSVD